MKSKFRDSFLDDVSKITNQKLLLRIDDVIEKIESANTIRQIPQAKKLSGSGDAYRIRVGDYRIGIFITGGDVAEFTRVLHRKEIYRYFP